MRYERDRQHYGVYTQKDGRDCYHLNPNKKFLLEALNEGERWIDNDYGSTELVVYLESGFIDHFVVKCWEWDSFKRTVEKKFDDSLLKVGGQMKITGFRTRHDGFVEYHP